MGCGWLVVVGWCCVVLFLFLLFMCVDVCVLFVVYLVCCNYIVSQPATLVVLMCAGIIVAF